ncbi:hypothetical protein PTQ52_28915, partial [Klebsiella michiganensis]|nr:hypothetical protein [Klebsiella michiganensis]
MADSQLQLSSDVIVDQHQETVKGKTSYFKNKVDDAKYIRIREGANKRGNSSRLTQSFHFFMFEPI